MGETRTRRSSRSRSTRASTRSTARADDSGDDQTPERTSRGRRGRHSQDAAEPREQPAPEPARDQPESPVRVPAALRVGQRRVVGPLIGAELAQGLLAEHQPDVLLEDRCGCGLAAPCPARAFFGGFFAADAHAAVMAGAEKPVGADGTRSARGRGTPAGRRPTPRHSSPESEPAADLDATQQIPAVPADPPPVAVAV